MVNALKLPCIPRTDFHICGHCQLHDCPTAAHPCLCEGVPALACGECFTRLPWMGNRAPVYRTNQNCSPEHFVWKTVAVWAVPHAQVSRAAPQFVGQNGTQPQQCFNPHIRMATHYTLTQQSSRQADTYEYDKIRLLPTLMNANSLPMQLPLAPRPPPQESSGS